MCIRDSLRTVAVYFRHLMAGSGNSSVLEICILHLPVYKMCIRDSHRPAHQSSCGIWVQIVYMLFPGYSAARCGASLSSRSEDHQFRPIPSDDARPASWPVPLHPPEFPISLSALSSPPSPVSYTHLMISSSLIICNKISSPKPITVVTASLYSSREG